MAVTIEHLSPELLVNIFSYYIELEGHENFSRNVVPVCALWWKLSTTPSLWKKRLRVRNWDFARSLCQRGLMFHIQGLEISGRDNKVRAPLHTNRLSTVLSNTCDLKSLEIVNYGIDANTMTIVANHCPNLNDLCMENVGCGEAGLITLRELNPILRMCGPKLKRLRFIKCDTNRQLITEIAAKCTSLEVFECNNNNDYSEFPIYEVMRGCPLLQKLVIHHYELSTTKGNLCPVLKDLREFRVCYCNFQGQNAFDFLRNSNNLKHLELVCNENMILRGVRKQKSNSGRLVTTGGNDYPEFKHLREFKVRFCDFQRLDVCSLLQNSSNLQHLELYGNKNMIFSDDSKIPSKKLKFIRTYSEDGERNVLPLSMFYDPRKWGYM